MTIEGPASVDHAALANLFLDFAGAVSADEHYLTDDILRELAASTMRMVAVDGSGIMLSEGGGVRFVHGSSPPTRDLELLQEALQLGPCRDAVATGTPVVEDDLAVVAQRWPGFAERAESLGLRSVAAVPVMVRGQARAVVDLYRSAPGGFSDDEVRAASGVAALAASYLVLAEARDAARAAQQELAHRALHDPLTGLPNRALLFDRLGHSLATAQRRGNAVAVVFIDLEDFKRVNDSGGHAFGDAVLVEVARRLGGVLRNEDTLARFGGDEFVLVCDDLPDTPPSAGDAADVITRRIRAALEDPVVVAGAPLRVGASIGVVITRPGQQRTLPDVDALLSAADAAMYRDKSDARRRPLDGVRGAG